MQAKTIDPTMIRAFSALDSFGSDDVKIVLEGKDGRRQEIDASPELVQSFKTGITHGAFAQGGGDIGYDARLTEQDLDAYGLKQDDLVGLSPVEDQGQKFWRGSDVMPVLAQRHLEHGGTSV